MSVFNLQDIAAATDGQVLTANVACTGVAIDTRLVRPGDLFIALAGERDGHDFVESARLKGAAAAMVMQPVASDLPQIQVTDTRASLAAFAAWWRQQYTPLVVGLTGSNGKTTVKELLHVAFGGGHDVLATAGNLNNDLGVPLTLLRLAAEHEVAIIEMGANAPGEIAQLSQWVQPNIALVNNAGAAHLAGFGSLNGVAKAKGELFTALSAEGTAIINLDDPHAPLWQELASHAQQITFGLNPQADIAVDAKSIKPTLNTHGAMSEFNVVIHDQTYAVAIPLAGQHNVLNTAAVLAVVVAADMDVRLAIALLAHAAPAAGRLQLSQLENGLWIANDSYNANPVSVKAAIDWAVSTQMRSSLVLGDMAELGADVAEQHYAIGQYAQQQGMHECFALGEYAADVAAGFGAGGQGYTHLDALLAQLQKNTANRDVLVIKGSRSARMERVIQGLGA